MATVLSSWFDDEFKSYFSYSTRSTNTTYSITVTEAGVYQDCTWSEYNWKTELSATSNSKTTGSVGVTYWNSGYHALITADKTYTFPRKTSAYNVTVSAKSTQVATGRNATASQTFTVPALPSYTVSFNANGGSGAPSAQTKWYGTTLTLSSTKPTRGGYTFVGWGTSTTDTTADWSAGGSYTDNAGRTLYAIWKKTITLTYDANGGSGAPSAQSATVYNATKNYTFTIPSTKPTRTGYTFLGWSTSASATTASYTSGKTITLSSNDTLYAVWKLITYTVKYDANGGTNAPASQTKKYGVDLTVSSTKPTRTGYTFLGWSVPDRGYDTAYYQPGGVIEYNGNQTLVAVWKINTYAVTYNANGGTNAPASQTKTYGTDLKLSTDVPTRQYYNFKGWATSKTGSVVYSAGGTYKTNAKVTLYAVWEVAYIKPRITAVSIIRCNKDEAPRDDGVYALLNFKWETDEPVTSIKIDQKLATAPDTSYSSGVYLDATDTSGSVIRKVGGDLSVELAYNYRITVADSTDSNYYIATLPAALFPIDLLAGGRGVTIGEPAKEEGFIVKFMSKFKSMVNVLTDFTFRTNDKGEDEIADSDGLSVLIPKTTSGNTTLGYGGYSNESKATNIYGNNVQVFAKKGMSIGKAAEYIESLGERLEVAWNARFYKDVEVDGALTLKQNLKFDSGTKVSTPIYIWDGNENGSGMAIGAGGPVVIGGGESARNFVTDMALVGTAEQTYITADGNIYFYTNCNTIANKKLVMYANSSGNLILNGNIGIENGNRLDMSNTEGTWRDVLQINSSNNVCLGYGSYSAVEGELRLFGAKMRLYSKELIYTNSGIVLPNNQNIYHYDKGGTARRSILYDNNNQLVLGYDQMASKVGNTFVDGNLLYLRSNGAIYANGSTISTSDEREKENIVPLGASPVATYGMRRSVEQVDIHSELFDKLKPVQFNYINRAEARTCFGLIAQDVLAALEELGFAENELDLVYGGVDTGEHTDRYGISYQNFTALLIHEVQKLKAKVMILEAERN